MACLLFVGVRLLAQEFKLGFRQRKNSWAAGLVSLSAMLRD